MFRPFLLTLFPAFILSCALSGRAFPKDIRARGDSFPRLIDATVDELASLLDEGYVTSVDLAYVDRIYEVNDTLNAVTELNPDALSIAAELDAERANGKTRGPLHGIPILIKNNIATMDKMNNTAGSYALLGATVPSDSTIAAKLRCAGVVILGKTGLSQWANFRSSNSSNGWSAYGGQVYGAYVPDQDPSGSSSGSGVASSVGLALAALGTETSGSILSPSNANNIVGIKPTVGLTSRYLVVPISEHQDTIGPMAHTVKDAAYILQAIAGKDPNDNYTLAEPFDTLPDYVAACDVSALKGKRLGIARNAITSSNTTAPIVDAFNSAISIIKEAGAIIIENTNFTAFEQFQTGNTTGIVLEADFVSDLPDLYLSKLVTNPHDVHSLANVSDFTHNFPLEDYPDRDTAVWDESLALGFNNSSPEFWAAYQTNLYLGGEGGILGALDTYDLDAVILPTRFAPSVPAIVGSPVVTVPLGAYPAGTNVTMNQRGDLVVTAPNFPFGISFLGRKWSEWDLIGFAYAFEQRTKIRETIAPYIEPTTELVDIVGI